MTALRLRLRHSLGLSLRQSQTSARFLSTSTVLRTTAGYGDPQSEKIANETPLPSSTTDPKPKGQGKGPGTKSGTTDPEVGGVKKGKTGNAGGKKGSDGGKKPSGQEIRETKKVGEDPKKEKTGGAGPIGG